MSTTDRIMDRIIANGRANHGERFDPSELAPQFAPFSYYGTGGRTRIKVRRTYANGETWERTGRVGMTGGWRPAFLLMHRSSDLGSSDVLGADDVIVAVKHAGARSYRPLHPSEVSA